MLKKYNWRFLFLLVISIFHFTASAQNEISSPYSTYGVGVFSDVTSGAYDAMGKVGYALQDPYLINFKNPASYVAFDTLSFIADAAFSIYSDALLTSHIKQQASYARPNYITLGLPIMKNWRMSAGILPFSGLGYNIIDKQTLPTIGEVKYNYQGHGGLLQLYWGNAVRLYKGFSIGVNLSYLFGTLTYAQTAEYAGEQFFHSMVDKTTLVDGIYISCGLQYFKTLKQDHTLGLGLVYENSAYLWTKERAFNYNYKTAGLTGIINDTISYSETSGTMQLPQVVGVGLSYQLKNKLWLSTDFKWQNATRFLHCGIPDQHLQDNYVTAIGVQYVPNYTSTNYLKKIRFRAGFQYSTGYLVVDNQSIRDFKISLGMGFPLKGYNNNSSIGVMFEYGQMGTIANNLIRENHFRFSLHFTLQEKWYQRVKLD